MPAKIHNLDESVQEYFEFVVNKYSYRFRHMNTEELEELKAVSGDEEKSRIFMYRFIEKVDPASPDFAEVAKKMLVPQWVNFKKMITSEFGG